METAELTSLMSSIRNANTDYRVGSPSVGDGEYDDKVDALRSAIGEKAFSEFRKTLTEEPGKVKHPYAMGSLEKVKAFDESCPIKDWIQRNVPENGDGSEGIFVSSKIDGCSARVTYANGILVGCSTRGDGSFGVDILGKAVSFIPTEVKGGFSGDIRGEITLTHETFDELRRITGDEYKNLRNATAGLINSKSLRGNDEISLLRFFPYEIMGHSGLTKKEQFSKLKRLGFTTALHVELTDIYNVAIRSYDDALLEIYNRFSEDAPYDIDGLVISDLNDTEVFEDEFIPSRTVAVKFNQMTAKSRLISVEWNVSKNGDLRPVGIIEPVLLGGAEVSAVTLNNLRIIREQGLKYGCSVVILKSGDIIPKIVGVSHPNPTDETDIEYPTVCPSCGSELQYSDGCLYPHCPNAECDEILYNKMLHFLKQLEIKHLSLKTIAKFGLKGVRDIVNLKDDDGAVKRRFIKDVYDKMFGADRETLLSAFDYNGVSTLLIGRMLSHYGFERLVTSTAEDLKCDLPFGIGEKTVDRFVDGYREIEPCLRLITSDERYHGNRESRAVKQKRAVVSELLNGFGFAVTGSLRGMSRKQFEDSVWANGGRYCSSVSKSTTYLVTNETAMTAKMKNATAIGVKVINEEQFMKMLGGNGEDFSIF